MKTPIQELIEFFDKKKFSSDSIPVKLLYDGFIDECAKLLEKEKNIIMDAWLDGLDKNPLQKQIAEEYYNKNFK